MKILMHALLAILGLVQFTESKKINIKKISIQEVESFAENCSSGGIQGSDCDGKSKKG